MKENKEKKISVRITEFQDTVLQKIVSQGLAKNQSAALQYLINQHAILNSK